MVTKTQGTELYVIDPADDSLIEVGCVTAINGVSTPVEQIETTCLAALARTFVSGLQSPGQATFGINFDVSDATHERLHEMLGLNAKWAIGFADDTGTDPTVNSSGAFVLPTTRSWLTFEGYIQDFPFDFSQNAVVQSQVPLQISGSVTFTKATS